MQKNQTVSLHIDSVNGQGAGVARFDGCVVFVPFSLPGEDVEALIIKVAKNYCVGKLLSVSAPSGDRVDAPCPYFGRCGGCTCQHMEYSAQLREKCSATLENMRHLSMLPLENDCILASPRPFGYRNKAQFPVGKVPDGSARLGFYAAHSHRLVPLSSCMLQVPLCNLVIPAAEEAIRETGTTIYDEATGKGILRHVVVRASEATNSLMVILVAAGSLPQKERWIRILTEHLPQMTSLILNRNTTPGNVILGKSCETLWGKPYLEDTLSGIRFHLQPLAFLQVNSLQAEKLYQRVCELAALSGRETVLDAYCGIGVMSLLLARRAKKVIGVEVVEEAVSTARESAKANGISNAEFLSGDCAVLLPQLLDQHPDVVVLDPPRAGCDAALIRSIGARKIQRVIYVSCDPASLARDLVLFSAEGYQPSPLTFVDLFSQTSHVETVCLLTCTQP